MGPVLGLSVKQGIALDKSLLFSPFLFSLHSCFLSLTVYIYRPNPMAGVSRHYIKMIMMVKMMVIIIIPFKIRSWLSVPTE